MGFYWHWWVIEFKAFINGWYIFYSMHYQEKKIFLGSVQVWRGTSRQSSMGSTWLSLWSWKPSRVLSTTRSPTSHWPCPSTAGPGRARISWPEWLRTTCIVTAWRASASGSSSPRSTSHTPGWWTPIRWDVQRCVCTGVGDLSQSHFGSIFRTLQTQVFCPCLCVFNRWMITITDGTSASAQTCWSGFLEPGFGPNRA